MDTVKSLVLDMVKGIVSYPDDVELHLTEDSDDKGEIIIINIKVAKEDIGLCIGEGGTTAEAIRKIVGLIGFRQTEKRVYAKIDAPKLPKNHYHNN